MNSCYDEYNKKVYLIWNEGKLPIGKTDLDKVFEVIDDVNAVSFDTWIYGFCCENFKTISSNLLNLDILIV
ncbi:CDI toxin immunity protein [Bacillus nitratireducens]|uniref:CDI toxin immunity protein n=1 Tax=Bacillus nitratireducens TaxID=2026193 RepID=UPI003AB44EB7